MRQDFNTIECDNGGTCTSFKELRVGGRRKMSIEGIIIPETIVAGTIGVGGGFKLRPEIDRRIEIGK